MMIVHLHGVLVGSLHQRASGGWDFSFAPSYWRQPARPVLSRSYEDVARTHVDFATEATGVPSFFGNYLPERGSPLRELLSNQVGIDPTDDGALLGHLGEDLPGAITVRVAPEDADPETVPPPPRRQRPTKHEPLRFSLAGMQLKFSVNRAGTGFTVPLRGLGGRWIAKLPHFEYAGVPGNEFAMLTLARACGIVVPEFELIPWRKIEALPDDLALREEDALVLRRYDRADDGTPIHQEDFAQVLGVSTAEKYPEGRASGKNTKLVLQFQHMGRLIRLLCGDDDFEAYLVRLTFMVLTGNCDAHLKNWSLVYPDRRNPRLAPAYDLVAVHAISDSFRRLALKLSEVREPHRVSARHLVRVAAFAGFSETRAREVVGTTVERFVAAWKKEGPGLPMSQAQAKRLDQYLRTLSLLRQPVG